MLRSPFPPLGLLVFWILSFLTLSRLSVYTYAWPSPTQPSIPSSNILFSSVETASSPYQISHSALESFLVHATVSAYHTLAKRDDPSPTAFFNPPGGNAASPLAQSSGSFRADSQNGQSPNGNMDNGGGTRVIGGNSGNNGGFNSNTRGGNGENRNKRLRITAFDPRLPPGGVNMITPAPISGPEFYKIGDFVTFAWNYTSLSITPTAIDVLATCTANQAMYTLTRNMTVEPTGRIIWDTRRYQASAAIPLLTETYTLIIHDSDSSISAIPKAGYLGVSNRFSFGMYSPQPYTPLSQFECATCPKSLASSFWKSNGDSLFSLTMLSFGTLLSFSYFITSWARASANSLSGSPAPPPILS